MLAVLPNLTAAYIEQQVSQEALMAYYLGIPESTIYDCLNRNKIICSPLRYDRNPTASFYFSNKGKLRFNDFAGYFHGDVYDVVGYLFSLSPSDSVDFNLILEQIAQDFKLHYFHDSIPAHIRREHIAKVKNKQRADIRCNIRRFTKSDVDYWKRLCITPPTLKKFDVFAVDAVYINGSLKYMYIPGDPCFGFYHGNIDDRDQWKLFWPKRPHGSGRYITNTSRIAGAPHFKPAQEGVLAKSLKEVMVLHEIDPQINSVGMVTENVLPDKEVLNKMLTSWQYPFCFTDFDNTGLRAAFYLKRMGFRPLFLTNGRYQSIDYRVKDLTDFVTVYGINVTRNLLDILRDNNYTPEQEFYSELIKLLPQ